jgi:hypothetical protein
MMDLPRSRTICFEHNLSARAVEVALGSDPAIILEELALAPFPRGAILISGGADSMC